MVPNGENGWVGSRIQRSGRANALGDRRRYSLLYPASQSATQCPNVTDILLEPGEGLSCSVGSYSSRTRTTGWPASTTLSDPRTACSHVTTSRSAYQSVPYSTNIIATALPGYPEIDNERNQYTTIEERHVFSPKILNEARFGFVRLHAVDGERRPQRNRRIQRLGPGPRQAGYGL